MSCEEEVTRIGKKLSKAIKAKDVSNDSVLDLLKVLEKQPMNLEILQKTRIGLTVNSLRKSSTNDEIVVASKALVKTWKRLLDSKDASASAKSTPSRITNSTNGSGSGEGDQQRTSSSQDSAGGGDGQRTSIDLDENSMHSEDSRLSLPESAQNSAQNGDTANRANSETPEPANSPPAATSSSSFPASPSCPADQDLQNPIGPMPTEASYTSNEVRLKGREMLFNSLTVGELPNGTQDPENLAARIEDAMYDVHRSVSDKYKAALRSRVFNLRDKKNQDLRLNILTGAISPARLASMTSEEMASKEMNRLRAKFTKEAIDDHQLAMDTGTPTDLFKCGKCKGNHCTYTQAQTRSADEPMTTFVLCQQCGNRWKFC